MAPLGAISMLAVTEVTLSDGGYASITPPIVIQQITIYMNVHQYLLRKMHQEKSPSY